MAPAVRRHPELGHDPLPSDPFSPPQFLLCFLEPHLEPGARSSGGPLPALQVVLGREVIIYTGSGLPLPRLLPELSHVLWPQGAHGPVPFLSPLILQDLLVEFLVVNPTQIRVCRRALGITWRSSVQGLGVAEITLCAKSCHPGVQNQQLPVADQSPP